MSNKIMNEIKIMPKRIFFFIMIIPLAVGILTKINSPLSITSGNDWIGFYANYLGSIIGVFGVYIVMKMDQEQRLEERKDEMFFNNLNSYREISSILKQDYLKKIYKDLIVLKKGKDWNSIDTKTKKELKIILDQIDLYDESNGLDNALRNFVVGNLSNLLSCDLDCEDRATGESYIFQDTPNEVIDEMTNILLKNIEYEPVYENKLEITLTKSKLTSELKRSNYLDIFEDKSDELFSILCKLQSSSEITNYFDKRTETFDIINKLTKQIDVRIEKVLNY